MLRVHYLRRQPCVLCICCASCHVLMALNQKQPLGSAQAAHLLDDGGECLVIADSGPLHVATLRW